MRKARTAGASLVRLAGLAAAGRPACWQRGSGAAGDLLNRPSSQGMPLPIGTSLAVSSGAGRARSGNISLPRCYAQPSCSRCQAGFNPGRVLTTMWLTSVDPATRSPDIVAYRGAVSDLLAEVACRGGVHDPAAAGAVLAERLREPDFAAVLSATPNGLAGSVRQLAAEVRSFRPSARSSAADLLALIRIYLFAQIDAMWWGRMPMYLTDGAVLGAAELVDLEPLRRAGCLGFRYRRQADALLTRAARAEIAPPGTPPLWVTSLVRSVAHQRHLRRLGYSAVLPSSHCAGYAMDIEISWFRRFDAHRALQALLLDRQGAGEINVIDEGQAWHVCISPAATVGLRRAF